MITVRPNKASVPQDGAEQTNGNPERCMATTIQQEGLRRSCARRSGAAQRLPAFLDRLTIAAASLRDPSTRELRWLISHTE